MAYSTLNLDYRQKRSQEIEKCFEIRSSGAEENKNVVRFRKEFFGETLYSLDLVDLNMQLKPSRIIFALI